MKTILFILSFTVCCFCHAFSENIFIELGQDFTLKEKVSRVWIENQKIIAVEPIAQGIRIKPLSLGQTRIRLNNKTVKVYVVPIGSHLSFQEWQKLSKKFIDLKVDFCEELVCLKGKLYQFKEFEKIISILKKSSSPLYLAAELSSKVSSEVQNYLENHQREKGLTPLRVVFSSPWKIHYGGKDFVNEYKTEMAKVGVMAIESKQKIEIADNVKVSIQVTEIKKEFRRTLGIQYPGTYSAQIIDPDNAKLIPFDVSLNAHQHDGNIKVLASPNLVCRSGKEAEFFAGGEFPIRVLNYKVNDVVWKKYGIGLKIKPIIDSVGQMSLQIDSEVSTLDESTKVDGIPGLQTNKVSSTFDLIRSRTIALSGLIKNEQGQSSEGVPFLKQIPVLGYLFASNDFRESRTELVIFVTPELLKNEAGLQ